MMNWQIEDIRLIPSAVPQKQIVHNIVLTLGIGISCKTGFHICMMYMFYNERYMRLKFRAKATKFS
jgi:hypothetical protein